MNPAQNWLTVETIGIGSVLKRQLRLPLNQREYSWEELHVEALFGDLSDAIASRPTYFLGTIVLMSDGDNPPLVVDGQQRLATTTILLAAIRDHYIEQKKESLARSIEEAFLLTSDEETGDPIANLKLNHDDDAYFQNFIINRADNRVPWAGKILKSHERIAEAARIAKDRVKDIVKGSNDPLSRILDWRRYLANKAIVLAIMPQTDMDAFRMFETLNDRGLRTSQADMLKNYLFEEAGNKQIETAQAKWSTMRGAIESCWEDDILLSYMRHFTFATLGPRPKKDKAQRREHGDFYGRIKGEVKGSRQSVQFLETLASYADDYVAIITPSHAKWNKYPSTVPEALQVIGAELKVVQIRPLLLAVAARFSPAEAAKAFRLFVCWTVRFMIAGGMRGQALEDAYAKVAQAVFSGSITKASQLRDEMSDTVPTNTTFENEFRTASVKQGNLARYYLRAIESTMRNNESDSPELEPVRDKERLNLEHILPLEPKPPAWQITEDEAQLLVNRIGNLTLLSAKANENVGNKSFADKAAIYKDSVLRITRTIPKEWTKKEWGAEAIAARQFKMAALAVKTWPLTFA